MSRGKPIPIVAFVETGLLTGSVAKRGRGELPRVLRLSQMKADFIIIASSLDGAELDSEY